ncbi:hypothetical protein Taro_021848 [Colocasia esculenta]|uniref:RNase H type-1 domain-containing protein n=1 Tax=Colocasia esculenta TaxID=4460 RepID=A0A843V013_COLES|nr:hypothetical protein [Colocasia esculenta]
MYILLSQAGRVILINFVLCSIPIYVASASCLPKSILHYIEHSCAAFFWNGADGQRRRHWVAWDRITSLKQEASNCKTASGYIATYVALLILWEIWKFRCAKCFDSRTKSVKSIISDIRFAANVAVQGMIFKKECSPNQLGVLQQFGFKPTVKLKVPKLVRWMPPQYGFSLNVDGTCKGNPGPCGGGGCIRDSNGDIYLGFALFYGQGNSMIAEVRTLCDGLRLAEHRGLPISMINSDSLVLVSVQYLNLMHDQHIYSLYKDRS